MPTAPNLVKPTHLQLAERKKVAEQIGYGLLTRLAHAQVWEEGAESLRRKGVTFEWNYARAEKDSILNVLDRRVGRPLANQALSVAMTMARERRNW